MPISDDLGRAIDRVLNVLFGYSVGGLPVPTREHCKELHDELEKVYQQELYADSDPGYPEL